MGWRKNIFRQNSDLGPRALLCSSRLLLPSCPHPSPSLPPPEDYSLLRFCVWSYSLQLNLLDGHEDSNVFPNVSYLSSFLFPFNSRTR